MCIIYICIYIHIICIYDISYLSIYIYIFIYYISLHYILMLYLQKGPFNCLIHLDAFGKHLKI